MRNDSRIDRRGFLVRGSLAIGAGALGLSGRTVLAFEDAPTVDALAAKALAFLKTRVKADGSWSSERSPGITALVITGLLKAKVVTPSDPLVTKGLGYLEKFVEADGGFAKGPQSNYVTTISLMAFNEANAKGQYTARIKAGQDYLKTLQWDEGEGKGPSDPYYGGAGYGGSSRPDLSNTSFFIDALKETGLPADDPALKKALVFVSRTQNLKSEFNDQPWADKVNDGGFVYTPAKGGASMAAKAEPNGALRSYASMTYAGLKSMIHAGLTPDDPRVKAALAFIKKRYTLDENPGMGQAGLFYYYQTFAKAMSLLGKPTFADDKGVEHDWRKDLLTALARRQAADGSWVNPADRFMEGDPSLVTAYALIALAYARPK